MNRATRLARPDDTPSRPAESVPRSAARVVHT